MKNPKLIATYARVSTALQEEQETINAQTNALKDYAKMHGFEIIQEYKDEGWSGDTLVRPSLDKLRQDARNADWSGILIYDPDRLARRYSYQELVMDELKEAGINVIYITVSTPKNSEDKILYGVRGLFAEYERAKISERFRLGKIRVISEGRLLMVQAPFGYNYTKQTDKEKGFITINEYEADAVRSIFKWVVNERLSLRRITLRLYQLGIKPKKSKRGVWTTSSVCKLLKNETYIGTAYWGKYLSTVPENPRNKEKYRKVKKSSHKERPKSEWYPMKVPPIISKEIFEKAAQIASENSQLSKRNRKFDYLLSGRLYCTCGHSILGESVKKSLHLYYRCSEKIKAYPLPRRCHERSINVRVLDDYVWDAIQKLMTNTTLIMNQLLKYKERDTHNINDIDKEIEIQSQQVEKLKTEIYRYTKAYGAGIYSVDELKEFIIPTQESLRKIEDNLKNLKIKKSNEIDLAIPDDRAIEEFVSNFKKVLQNLSFEQKRAIVLRVVDKVIARQGEYTLNGYLPFDYNENSNVVLDLKNRHTLSAIRHTYSPIPFQITNKIPLPSPGLKGSNSNFQP